MAGCKHAAPERKNWEMRWLVAGLCVGLQYAGLRALPAASAKWVAFVRRRRADLIRVKGPPPVNAQRRAGSARAPALVPGPGTGFAAGAR